MADTVLVVKESELVRSHKAEHEPYEYYKMEITKRADFGQCYAAIYEIPPQKSNYPFHFHEKNTEVFYILSGRGILRTEEREISVCPGDVIVCPPGDGSAHKLTNSSESEVLKYLDVDTTNSPDTVHYPDSEKIGVIRHNESAAFYRDGKETDYYDGE